MGRTLCAIFLLLFAANEAFSEPMPTVALPPIETVDYNTRGGLRVNGKPFFPIMLYDAKTDADTLAQLRDFGFNVLTCHPETSASLPAQGFYAAVHGRKQSGDLRSMLLAIGTDSPALYFKQNLLRQTADANAKVAALAPGRPLMNAIGYWEDEPEGVFAGKLPSRAKYDELVAALDVAAPYLYPIPYQPLSSVGDAVARARVATLGQKPLLPILQLFAWKVTDRYPTPAELRCMVFLSLVEGATGIGYYSYSHVTGRPQTTIAAVEPQLWSSVRAVNRELADVGPRLIARPPLPGVSLESKFVNMKAISDDQGTVIVLVNPSAQEQRARLVWQTLGDAPRFTLSDGRTVSVEAGVLKRTLEPFAVEILRASPTR